MRLYHDRMEHRSGPLGSGDEEECFTAKGRRTGVFLTTEALDGDLVVATNVVEGDVLDYEVTGDDAGDTRLFVVPGNRVATWIFNSTAPTA